MKVPIQVWYADDSQAAGKLTSIRRWWGNLCDKGPAYGYFPKPPKTYLNVKDGLFEQAEKIFEGTNIQIVGGANRDEQGCGGKRDLGAAIGSAEFIK